MLDKPLRERCNINTNVESDTFVGIKANKGDIAVNFPLGYRLSDDERELRKDILLLLNTLSTHTDKKDSEINTNKAYNEVEWPIQAYLHIISDYFSRGYYKEREIEYKTSKRGKINWNRTIKTQKAYIQDDNVFFLDYVTKVQNVNENEIITLIHVFCVYESFMKLGWLFSDYVPKKPTISIYGKKAYYSAVVRKKLAQTFNDRNRELFKSMIAIIDSLGDESKSNTYHYGTYRFEYVWESMLDSAYGIRNKEQFFPKTRWVLKSGKYSNAALEPDSIMIFKDKIYVLDAKYYKYGYTGKAANLPESTSINKQITYGEYIAESERFKNASGEGPTVYNAFIMPYNSYGKVFPTMENIHYIGTALSDWKSSDGTKPYEQVVGVLMDVKNLMKQTTKDYSRIIELAELIENSIMKL